jgi:hypothetical protein
MKAKKIIKVLKFIRKYCEDTSCAKCEFQDKDTKECMLKDMPVYYNIKQIKKNLKVIERID